MSLKETIKKEWLFWLSFSLFLLSSSVLGRFPDFSLDELEVLFLLSTLFVTIKGLELSGFLEAMALRFEKGALAGLKLVAGTFALALFVTNDVALAVMVPMTLAMQIQRKDLLVIMEAIAANSAALFPFSNPQNLYIYWHYHLDVWTFVEAIAPFVLFFLIVVLVIAVSIKAKTSQRSRTISVSREAWHFLAFFFLIVLSIFKVVPLFVAGLVLFYALVLYPRALCIDYFLLATFFFFFGISDNFQYAFAKELANPHHVFLSSVALSQLISNVPAAIVMADFTSHWREVLWGVNVGGFGVLWGSLANLIAFKLYTQKYQNKTFLPKFLLFNFIALGFGVGLFFFLMAS